MQNILQSDAPTNSVSSYLATSLEDIEPYISKIKAVLTSEDTSAYEREHYITRILNIYLNSTVDYTYAVEQICHCVKRSQLLIELGEGDAKLERSLKVALRQYLFELIARRGTIKGTSFCVFIKERKPYEKKIRLKCAVKEIPPEYLQLSPSPNRNKIKNMLAREGKQDWVEFDPASEHSLWITNPDSKYIPRNI